MFMSHTGKAFISTLFAKQHRRDPNRAKGGRRRRMSRGNFGRMEGRSKKMKEKQKEKRGWRGEHGFFFPQWDLSMFTNTFVSCRPENIIQRATHNVRVRFPWSESKQTSHQSSDVTKSLIIVSHYFQKTGMLICDRKQTVNKSPWKRAPGTFSVCWDVNFPPLHQILDLGLLHKTSHV